MIGMSIKRISVLNLCHVLKPFVKSTPDPHLLMVVSGAPNVRKNYLLMVIIILSLWIVIYGHIKIFAQTFQRRRSNISFQHVLGVLLASRNLRKVLFHSLSFLKTICQKSDVPWKFKTCWQTLEAFNWNFVKLHQRCCSKTLFEFQISVGVFLLVINVLTLTY